MSWTVPTPHTMHDNVKYLCSRNDVKEQDRVLDCFAGVNDPEPLRMALQMLCAGHSQADIGKMIVEQLNWAMAKVSDADWDKYMDERR